MSLTSKEEEILKSIFIASDNNPKKPEFPVDNPKFPATPTYKINTPHFNNVWIKDESCNITRTHKDRMAWEIIVTYRDFLLAKKHDASDADLPIMSIISSGSAAYAIQSQLRKYKLPNLRVLVDQNFPAENIEKMIEIGCEIFKTDLSRKSLGWKDILELTDNPQGFDITSNEALNPRTRFYDWLSYEIINSSPLHCFIPFGTGHLFENILNVSKHEVSGDVHDPRFRGDLEILSKCNFYGAATKNSATKAVKLYSPFLPFSHYDEQWIRLYKLSGFCGRESGVYFFEEKFLDEAIKIATTQNIKCEPSGIAGLALLLQMKDKISQDDKILIVNTGKSCI